MKRNFYTAIFSTLFFATTSFAQVPSYVPSSGLQAWFGFNGNSNDLSGNANNATNNGATFIADRNGNANAAASFNGTTNYLVVTTPSFQFTPTGAFTYSFWLNKQTNTGGNIAMMSGTSTTGVFITLIQGATNFTFGTNKQQSAWVNVSCAHTLNVWDHYVTTYNAGIMKIYKNGTFQSTTTYSYTGATTATIPFYIGKGIAVSGGNFKGYIDDVGIWNRELTTPEISALFTSITAVPAAKANQSITIYPNPTSDFINLKVNTSDIGLNYRIFNLEGKNVFTGKLAEINTTIDMKGLSSGTYFVEIGDGSERKYTIVKTQE